MTDHSSRFIFAHDLYPCRVILLSNGLRVILIAVPKDDAAYEGYLHTSVELIMLVFVPTFGTLSIASILGRFDTNNVMSPIFEHQTASHILAMNFHCRKKII